MFKATLTAAAIIAGLVATTATAGKDDGHRAAHFAQIDTNSDGEITAAELSAQAAARFAAADVNGDGALTPAEMAATATGKRKEKMLERFDADKNGSLSEAEIATALEGRMGKRIAKRFEKADADKSGSLTIEEMQSRRDPAKMIAKLDKDSSGGLSLEEFSKGGGHGKDKKKRKAD
ncbi:calcium sensor EFh [Sulfitobacter sp. HNIBRBA2951]|uniref:EF-hand domain-containing protein n=1 Tax=Sulfitobacter aquimarinus TaxID=3158557 RepID=UPI0032DE454A